MAATLKALDMQIEGTSIRLPSHADIVDGLGTFVDGKINTFSSTKVVPALNGLSDLYLGKSATAAKATADANGVNIANNYLKASVAASTYLGKSAEASIATKARQDGDGNVISSTYLKSSAASTTYLAKADKYSHPTQTALTGAPTANQTPAFGDTFSVSQASVNTLGHVTALTSRTIKIPSTTATQSVAGLMSAADKTKLDGLSSGGGGTATLAAAATKLATARRINGVGFNGSKNINFGGTCSTAAATAAKVVEMTYPGEGLTLDQGTIVAVTFQNVNTANEITLNIGDTGALPVYRDNVKVSGAFTKNSYGVVLFKYCMGGHTGNTSNAYWEIVEPSMDMSRATGALSIAHGGTGATTAALARASLGAAASDHTHTGYAASSHNHAASAINSGVLPVARGGTGASTTALALATLGAAAANHTHSGYAATSHTHAAGDIASGTLAVARGGTGATSLASITVGKASQIETARRINGVGFNGSKNINFGGTCSTAAATAAKVVEMTYPGEGFTLDQGVFITVTFSYINTANEITLNVGGTGALPVYRDNKKVSGAFTGTTYGVVMFKYCLGGHTGNTSTAYWEIAEPSLDVSRASAGTLAVARGGTGQTSLANVKVGSATAADTADSLSGARTIASMDPNFVGNARLHGICSTAAATAAKTVTINGYNESLAGIVLILFTEVNTADNPTLSINGSTARPLIRYAATAYKTKHITDHPNQCVWLHWNASFARIVEGPAPKFLGAITGTPTLTSANERAITTTFVPSVGLRTVSIEVNHSTYQGNLDNMKTSGNYLLQTSANFSSWHKLPTGYSGQNFILEVIGNNTGLIVQRLSAPMVNACFIRFYYVTNTTSTWTKWMKLTGTEVDATA